MNNKKFLSLFMAFLMLLTFIPTAKAEETSNLKIGDYIEQKNGKIKILSVTPDNNLTSGTTVKFKVKVEYSFEGMKEAVLYIGFNNRDKVGRYHLYDEKVVTEKSGQYEFDVATEVKNWGNEGNFRAYVNISEYPHPEDWSPIASERYNLEVGEDDSNDNIFDGIEWETKTTDNSRKTWTIKFNQTINPSSVILSNIYITDEQGNKIPTTDPKLFTDEKSIIITPIAEYESGKIYYLYIKKEIKSPSGQNIKNNIRMPFVYIGG